MIESYIKHWWLFLFIWLFMLPGAWAATVTTRIDRNPVHLDESFRVIFETDHSVDASPDFSPLEQYFDIVNRSHGTSMQIINGRMSNKTQWTLTLLAKQVGRFVIPSISFGSDSSETVTVAVEPARQGQSGDTGEISLEVTASPKIAYVQAQIVYTVRLLRAVNLVNASLSDPEVADGDAVVEKLGDDREYETQRNGVRYAVLERSYAIYPQQSGDLGIKPVVFEGQVVDRGRSLFDPFAQSSHIKRLQSKPIQLKVKPVPQDAQGSHWLPAKGLELVEEWPDPLEFRTGEPVTRTITLRATGLTAAQLPKIETDVPEGIKLYPDQPALNDDKKSDGIIGSRQEKVAMIPTHEGDFTLPAIEIPWWNTETDRQEMARAPARTIHVLAAESSQPTSAAPAPLTQQQGNVTPPISNKKTEMKPVNGETIPSTSGVWFWVSIILAIGWLLTVVWFVLVRRSSRISDTAKHEHTDSMSRIRQRLRKACQNDAATDAKTLLLEWAGYQWQNNPPKNLGEIGKRSGGELANEINALTQSLYRPGGAQWKGADLWQAFERYSASVKTKRDTTGEVLAPLYP